MPITKQAIKRNRQNIVSRARNLRTMSAWQKLFKKVQKSITDGKTKIAEETLPALYKALDTASKKNVLSENKAARKKSQASRLIKEAGGKMVKAEKAPAKKAPAKKKAAPAKKAATTAKKATPAKKAPAKKAPAKKKADK